MLPRSFDLSEAVGKFRAEVEEMLENGEEKTVKKLEKDYRLDRGAAKTVVSHLSEQKENLRFYLLIKN